MSDSTHRPGGRTARWRTLAAVLSLYGMVLQAFLIGLDPVPAAAGAGLLCQGHHDPAGTDAPAQSHACCAPACPGPFAPPAPGATQAWPVGAAVGPAWRVAAAAPPRGPACGPASARGPPVA